MSTISLQNRHETARRETFDLSRVPKSRVPCQNNMQFNFEQIQFK